MRCKIIIFGLFSIFEIQATITDLQLDIVKSISNALHKKQIIIVNNLSEEKDKYKSMVKYFSSFQIYTLFRSSKEMDPVLMELVAYGYPTYKYNPRTIVIIDTDVLPEIAQLYFNLDFDLVAPKITWILFNNKNERITEQIKGSYVPYNCQFLVLNPTIDTNYEILEIYKINHLMNFFQVQFGTWNKKNDLIVPVNDFYARRIDFNGTVLGIQSSCKLYSGEIRCDFAAIAIFYEIIVLAAKMMNFRYERIPNDDNTSLNNFMKNHPNSFIEFFLHQVFFYDSIDYHPDQIPVWSTRAYLHVGYNKQYEKGMSSPFIRPFTKRLWFSIGAWILASTLILMVITIIINRHQKSSQLFNELIDACFTSFESFTNQRGSRTCQETDAYRIVTFTIWIPPLFLVLAYSGIIVSFVTVRIIQLPFENLEEFVDDRTFKIGYAKDSFVKLWFQNTEDRVAKLAYEKYAQKEEDMPIEYTKGVNKMCSDFKFSFIHFDDILFQLPFDCQPLQIPSPLFKTNVAFGLRMYSPLKSVVTRTINSIRSAGFIDGLNKRIVYTVDDLLARNTKDFLKTRSFEIDTVDWDAVESVFVFLGMAYITAIIIFLIECYILRFIRNKKGNFNLKSRRRSNYVLKIEDFD